ncbi:MAG: type IV secretion system DNA-binding domain-containing protein [Deltaproteobacteria bacterium]|nr:type IV secretion system DNA-binding domain-containing protein [Deltaproteobacteria bacterium]
MNHHDDLLPLGAIDARLQRGRVFGIREADLLRHVHVLGRTGVGKSALLERLAMGAIERGMGLALIDPHGDLAERVLDQVPTSRTNDVVVLDAGEELRPLGWNLLEHVAARDRARVVSGVVGIFKKVFFESWGPRLEHVLRNTLLALLEVPDATLLSALRMLVDDAFRTRVIARVEDPLVKFFWTREFAQYPRTFLAGVIAPVQNKLAAALTSTHLRAILGQHRSTTTAGEILRKRRVFIANVAKGVVGEQASAMLGAVLTTSFQLAAFERARVAPAERHPFLLVADEFQSFVTKSFAELLAEARKYGLGLVLAHQHLAQLDEGLTSALLGNCGTLVTFRVGAEDAGLLAREFSPELDAEDLVRLDRYQIALRLAVDGLTTRPFTATTLPPVGEVHGRAELLRRLSRERYGRDRARVDAEVVEDLGLPPTAPRRPRAGENLRLHFE